MARAVRPSKPRQDRSLRTRDRIRAAVLQALQHASFEDLSLRAVARQAKVALGSFYNLYSNKAALLPDLYEWHRADLADALARELDPRRWTGADLRTLLQGLVTAMVDMHRRQRGLLRALVLAAHGRGDREPVQQPEDMREVVPRIAALVATRAARIRRRPAVQAAAIGCVAVLALVRENVLFPRTTAHVLHLDDDALVRAATGLWWSFLVTPEAA